MVSTDHFRMWHSISGKVQQLCKLTLKLTLLNGYKKHPKQLTVLYYVLEGKLRDKYQRKKKIPKQTYECIDCAPKKSVHPGTVLENSITHLTSKLIFTC